MRSKRSHQGSSNIYLFLFAIIFGFWLLPITSVNCQKPPECRDAAGNCCVDTNDNSCAYPYQMFDMIKGQGNLFDFADGETKLVYIKAVGNVFCGNVLLEPKTGDNCYFDERVPGPQCIENCDDPQSCNLTEIGFWDNTVCSSFSLCSGVLPQYTIGSNTIVFHGYEIDGNDSYWYYEITSGTSPSISHVTFGLVCPNGTIGNYVWLDEDQDGIQDINESGLNGVNVKLFDSQDQMIATAITSTENNIQGHYSFENLIAGDYHVTIEYPQGYGISPKDVGDDSIDSDIEDSGNGEASTGILTLASSEDDITIDGGLIQSLLPVRFGSFDLKKIRNQVVLEWSTYSEVNNSGFYIEKASDNPADFASIGFVAGAGFSYQVKNYSFTDLNLGRSNSRIYYRLRQVDNDGSESFSTIRSVSFNLDYKYDVFPNPSTGIVSMVLPETQSNKQIRVFNMLGKIIYDLELSKEKTYHQFDLRGYEEGIYLIHIDQGSDSKFKKVILNY